MSYDQHISAAKNIVVRCAIITLSDTRTPETDLSGQKIRQLLEQASHLVADYQLIRDEPSQLNACLDVMIANDSIDVILTNGGTGISRRDQTIDTITGRLQRMLPGFGELFRMLSFQQIGSGAMLSRSIAGVVEGKILFAMPGSTKAVELAMQQLILPQLQHLVNEIHKG
jgi:molybdenum cofactor biosynthesis protein B